MSSKNPNSELTFCKGLKCGAVQGLKATGMRAAVSAVLLGLAYGAAKAAKKTS